MLQASMGQSGVRFDTAVGLIVALVGHKASPLDHLPVQAEDVQGGVVAASQHESVRSGV